MSDIGTTDIRVLISVQEEKSTGDCPMKSPLLTNIFAQLGAKDCPCGTDF